MPGTPPNSSPKRPRLGIWSANPNKGLVAVACAAAAAGGVRIGFNVDDLDAFHERMRENGVSCVQEPMVQFGARLAQYAAPDGLVFSVGESRKG